MKVYFEGNFWGHRKYERAGIPISVNQEFMWGEQSWRIPAVYFCKRGLVVDFCILVPRQKVEAFFKKWNYSKRLSNLTKDEENQMERENPFSINFKANIRMGKAVAESKCMCGTGWSPIQAEQEYDRSESEELMNAYGCSRENGWWFVRAHFLWPEGERPKLEALPKLEISLSSLPVCYVGPHFAAEAGGSAREMEVSHPVTGEKYTLRLWSCKAGELPSEGFWNAEEGMEYPCNFQAITYSIEPELSQEEFRIEDSMEGDPVKKNGKTNGACAVGLIGGGSSASKVCRFEEHEEQKRVPKSVRMMNACSSLRFKPVQTVEWRTLFYRKEKEDKLITIRFSGKELR